MNERALSINDKTVYVRELRAIDGLEFISKLSGYAGQLIGIAETRSVSQESLAALIIGASELSSFLVRKATRDAIDPAEVGMADFLDVLNVALEVNLSDATLKKATAVADTVRQRLGMKTLSATSSEPSNS